MKIIETQTHNLEIIAGPCSIDANNFQEIFAIANIATKNGPAVSGTRTVGLKSRTTFDATGKGMGIDWESIDILMKDPSSDIVSPSVMMAEEIVRETGMRVATEVMMPHLQLPQFVGRIPEGKLIAWNPSVNQLGWQVLESSRLAAENGWSIGLKNGKALGASLEEAASTEGTLTPMETTWEGLASYAQGVQEIIFIHRGVDVPEKGNHRNAPVHEAAQRVKKRNPQAKMFLDPSHIFGPKMRDNIVEQTLRAMHMKHGDGFLYDGILLEAGTSTTDTKQHITLPELEGLVIDLAQFRRLRGPEPKRTIFQGASV